VGRDCESDLLLFKCGRRFGVEIKRMDAPSLHRLDAHCARESAACTPDGVYRQAIFYELAPEVTDHRDHLASNQMHEDRVY
jgi:hypothetical protein